MQTLSHSQSRQVAAGTLSSVPVPVVVGDSPGIGPFNFPFGLVHGLPP